MNKNVILGLLLILLSYSSNNNAGEFNQAVVLRGGSGQPSDLCSATKTQTWNSSFNGYSVVVGDSCSNLYKSGYIVTYRSSTNTTSDYYNGQSPPCIYDQDYYDVRYVYSGAPCISGRFTPDNKKSFVTGEFYSHNVQCLGDKNVGIPNETGGVCVGNPVNPLTGNKFETLFSLDFGPGISLTYNNKIMTSGMFGRGVLSAFDSRIVPILNTPSVTTVIRPDGKEIEFTLNSLNWEPTGDINDVLIRLVDGGGNTTGWTYTLQDKTVESYDSKGNLTSVIDRNGVITKTLVYNLSTGSGGDGNNNTLDKVTNERGEYLVFKYDVNSVGFVEKVSSIVDPAGNNYRFKYTIQTNFPLLTRIVFPDSTPSDPNDNKFKQFTYIANGNTYSSIYNLLSITNENNNQIATWTYDSNNRVLTSQHIGGLESTSIDYTNINHSTDPRIKVTNALGKDTIYHYTTINGKRLVTQVEGLASANCVAANQSYTYDANGNYDIVTDWEGNITDYDFDLTRNLETQRIEAKNTVNERKIITQYHSTFNLPIQIDVYDDNNVNIKRTAFTYDSNGNLLTAINVDL